MYQEREITPMLVFATFSAVLGMFQFGFNTGVINTPKKVLEDYLATVYKARTGRWMTEELRDILWSAIVCVFAIGGMIGGLVAPLAANWCGRKTGLVLNNTIAVLGITLMSSSELIQSIECLIVGRFFIGLNCGLNTALVPMYLSEISSVNLRGALITMGQLSATIGLIFSQVLGLKDLLGTKDHWPFLFGFAFVPAILQLLMLPFCPESPRYLLLNCGRLSEARLSLRRLRATPDIEHDIEEIRAEEQHELETNMNNYHSSSSINNTNYHTDPPSNSNSRTKIATKLSTSLKELLETPHIRTPLFIAIMMQLSQQLSGMNAIFYFSTDIFLWEEVPESLAVYATIGVGAIMVLMTLVSIPLMDRVGRRTLHLYGLAGMFLAGIFLTISLLVKFLYEWMKYISVISTLFYTLFYAIGPASIPYLISSELFTQSARPAAMSVSVFVNWTTNFLVAISFPVMKRLLQSYLFLPFTIFMAIFWIIVYKKLPETKNRTFEEIVTLFKPLQIDPRSPAFYTGNNNPSLGNQVTTTSLVDTQQQSQISSGSNPPSNLAPRSNHFIFDEAVFSSNLKHQQQQHQQQYQNNKDHKHYQSNHQGPLYGGSGPIGPPPPPVLEASSSCCHPHLANDGSSGHELANNSCTSILANLSTNNDQQPLLLNGPDEINLSRSHGKWCSSTTTPTATNTTASLSQQPAQVTPTSGGPKGTIRTNSIGGLGHSTTNTSTSACCTCSTSSGTTITTTTTDKTILPNERNSNSFANRHSITGPCDQADLLSPINQPQVHRAQHHKFLQRQRHSHLANCEDDDDEVARPNWILHHHSSHHHLRHNYEDCDDDLDGDHDSLDRLRSKTLLTRKSDFSLTLGRINRNHHFYQQYNARGGNNSTTSNDKYRYTSTFRNQGNNSNFRHLHNHLRDHADDSGSETGANLRDDESHDSHCFRHYANHRASISDLNNHNIAQKKLFL